MTTHEEAEEWKRARAIVPQWRSTQKDEVVAACGDNVRLLTKVLVLLDQDERQELIACWSLRGQRGREPLAR